MENTLINDPGHCELSELKTKEKNKMNLIEKGYFKHGDCHYEVGYNGKETYFIGYDVNTQNIDAHSGVIIKDDEKSIECKPFKENSLIKEGTICFPDKAEPYENGTILFNEIKDFINKYVTFPKWFLLIATIYVFLTWLYDRFEEVPYLRLKGDADSGKSRGLKVLGHICYRGMFFTGADSNSAIYRSLNDYRGTLAIDEFDRADSSTRADIIKIFNNGYQKGFPVHKSEMKTKEFKPISFLVYGSKVIANREAFQDNAIETRCFTNHMDVISKAPHVPLSLDKNFYNEARLLRNKL